MKLIEEMRLNEDWIKARNEKAANKLKAEWIMKPEVKFESSQEKKSSEAANRREITG